jgi:hypothetical protein
MALEEADVTMPVMTLRPEHSKFEQWVQSRQPKLSATGCELERYYRLEPEQVRDPVQWWIDHRSAFPQLSRFALDVLAIPAMAPDYARAFSLTKLTVTSQRHFLLESTVSHWGACVGATKLGRT